MFGGVAPLLEMDVDAGLIDHSKVNLLKDCVFVIVLIQGFS